MHIPANFLSPVSFFERELKIYMSYSSQRALILKKSIYLRLKIKKIKHICFKKIEKFLRKIYKKSLELFFMQNAMGISFISFIPKISEHAQKYILVNRELIASLYLNSNFQFIYPPRI